MGSVENGQIVGACIESIEHLFHTSVFASSQFQDFLSSEIGTVEASFSDLDLRVGKPSEYIGWIVSWGVPYTVCLRTKIVREISVDNVVNFNWTGEND